MDEGRETDAESDRPAAESPSTADGRFVVCDPAVVRERIAAREGDESDADVRSTSSTATSSNRLRARTRR